MRNDLWNFLKARVVQSVLRSMKQQDLRLTLIELHHLQWIIEAETIVAAYHHQIQLWIDHEEGPSNDVSWRPPTKWG